MDLGLSGRSIVVTGGSSGIGLAVVHTLLAEGARVAMCGRDQAHLEAATASMPPEAIMPASADVTDAEAMNAFVDKTVDRFGRLDGIAAIAGEGIHGRALDLSPHQWQAEMLNKLAGVLNVVRPARVHLARSDAARVVTITAPAARDPAPQMAAISAARAAVANLTRSLALELADEGIAVNAIAVGLIDTDRQRRRHRDAGVAAPYEEWLSAEADRRAVPLRGAGTPLDVARLIVFALSPALGYTTGAVLDATGGAPGP